MREIEIKAKLTNKAAVLALLQQQNIQLSGPLKQHDVVYGIAETEDNAPGSIWLRLRTENDNKTIFTLKKAHTGGLDSIEHETEVTDPKEAEAIVKELGYSLYSDLTKYRQKAKFNGIEICIDEVEGLGAFIELEKIAAHDADGDAIRQELWSILNDFGITQADEILEGYDVLHNRMKAAKEAA